MLGNSILPQSKPNNNNRIDPCDAAAWLTDKISYYEAEISRLEAELKHAKVLLRGHQTWLKDIERAGGAK